PQENSSSYLLGTGIRFKKGKWIAGADKTEIPDRTRYVVLMNEISYGWMKWTEDEDTGRRMPVHIGFGKISEGHKIPPKDTLPDRDKTFWPINAVRQTGRSVPQDRVHASTELGRREIVDLRHRYADRQ